ncbi:MAG: glycosyl hydrolase family 95 catalytic domain-containing protein [Niabella sp.]
MKLFACALLLAIACSCTPKLSMVQKPVMDLNACNIHFNYLPKTWDEGLPLGNGEMGALVWQKNEKLRLSLDHVDLWDLRRMPHLHGDTWKYKWVIEQWRNNQYKNVQDIYDVPYNRTPAPSKIPGGALELNTAGYGDVTSSTLDIATAIATVEWRKGVKFSSFVHANQPLGWFKLEGLGSNDFLPELVVPAYNLEGTSEAANPVTGQDLRQLGYKKGTVTKLVSGVTYMQPGWNGFEYQITIRWKKNGNAVEGCWSISVNTDSLKRNSLKLTETGIKTGYDAAIVSHKKWWKGFWAKSAIQVPDTVLQKQWYLEQYKFGAAARENTPPISLQAVWTADNGKLPPWKGDFHNDLNTQLSYWPCFTANHIDLGKGYLNWMWKNYPNFKSYTKTFFETNGVNVPGVSTLTGDPMGGWIQYSFGPTVSAWMAQNFYLQWKYSMDKKFLKDEAYPWFKEVAVYLDELSEKTADGHRKLPLSASPEIHDNSQRAWFGKTTNFDLANIKFVFEKAAELAAELGYKEEEAKWKSILLEWPDFAVDETGLMISPDESLRNSHRHFSHLLAIHPLSLINWTDGEEARDIIKKSIANLKKTGSSAWTGYSFSWYANLQARMLDGGGAAESLRIFATSFCLPNSFHANGDQSGKGYSNFKYRPFTLEGNFAFASGLQEMLLQSHEGFVRLFPAIPSSWSNASFNGFLTQGAFEINASKINAKEINATITAHAGGLLKIINPFGGDCMVNNQLLKSGELFTANLKTGRKITLHFIQP